MKHIICDSTKLRVLSKKDSHQIRFTCFILSSVFELAEGIWAPAARVHTSLLAVSMMLRVCCFFFWRAIPPALEKPFSVYGELIFNAPLTHAETFTDLLIFFLFFFCGPLGTGWKRPSLLGHFSTEWALKTWEGCRSWKECGGVPKLAVQTVITPPFLSSFASSALPSLLIQRSWRERRFQDNGCACCLRPCPPLPRDPRTPIILLTPLCGTRSGLHLSVMFISRLCTPTSRFFTSVFLKRWNVAFQSTVDQIWLQAGSEVSLIFQGVYNHSFIWVQGHSDWSSKQQESCREPLPCPPTPKI